MQACLDEAIEDDFPPGSSLAGAYASLQRLLVAADFHTWAPAYCRKHTILSALLFPFFPPGGRLRRQNRQLRQARRRLLHLPGSPPEQHWHDQVRGGELEVPVHGAPAGALGLPLLQDLPRASLVRHVPLPDGVREDEAEGDAGHHTVRRLFYAAITKKAKPVLIAC